MKTWNKATVMTAINTKYTRFNFHRVLEILVARQTEDEKYETVTKHKNAMGFQTGDAPKLTALYNKAMGQGGEMSQEEFEFAKGRVQKYWRQFIICANAKAASKAA